MQNLTKNPEWKQNNPFDQLTTITNALAGDIDNILDGIVSKKIAERVDNYLNQLHQLNPFLQHPENW